MNNCLTCYGVRSSPPACVCPIGSLIDDPNGNCPKCARNCEYCSLTIYNCISCSKNRKRNEESDLPACNCLDGYYDNGVDSEC